MFGDAIEGEEEEGGDGDVDICSEIIDKFDYLWC